jgi:single-stranded DNA-binding protein
MNEKNISERRILLIGALAEDAQIRKIRDSFSLLTFPVREGLVISPDGPRENEHLRVILWQRAGDLLLSKLKAGSLVSIKGTLRTAAFAAYHDQQLLEVTGGELTLLSN